MFVRSLMDRDVVYRKGGIDWVIKAGTVTYVDENKVTAKEIKGLYGSRVIIVSRDVIEDGVAESIIKNRVEVNRHSEKVEPAKLDEQLIDDIIAQIEEEAGNEEERKKVEAEEKAKKEAEAKKLEEEKKLVEEKAKKEAEAKKLEEEKAKKEAEEKAKKEATKQLTKTTSGKRRGRRKVNK